ncbi:DUF58 domain-containing protein [Ilumatobacter sp.]|uniref:DUF58 domain-containing protein n=1 Tax=Ilumatobacter sp. TaxID=1967498 RepID=UPI003C68FC0F
MSPSRTDSWQPSPAHLRAVLLGVLGVAAALLFRVPILLVLATPFAFVAVWSMTTRPHERLDLSTALAPRTIREGEATTWTGRFDAVGDHGTLDSAAGVNGDDGGDGVDQVIAFVPHREWLETRPGTGVVAAATAVGGPPAAVSMAIRGTHWGPHEVGPINVVAVSSWGAFRWKAVASRHHLTTLPLPEVFDATASQHRANGLVGIDRSAHAGDGSEFSGIRPFQTGDRLRRINWQRSLRNGELHVTSTYSDQDSHVALFVDALADFGPSEGIDGAASSLDTTVRAAGAIAEHFLLRGDRVSLHVFGSRGRATLPPGSGRSHLRRILDRLAMLEPDPSRTGAFRVSRAAIPGDALAIMLSPLISPVALERAATIVSHGLTAAVVDTLPTDVHDGHDTTTELAWRIRLLERRREVRVIEEIGVPVIAWRGPGSLDPFLRELARRSAAPRMARR